MNYKLKLNSVSPFSGKYSPVTIAYVLFSHLNVITNLVPNYVNPQNSQFPTPQKSYQSSLIYALAHYEISI